MEIFKISLAAFTPNCWSRVTEVMKSADQTGSAPPLLLFVPPQKSTGLVFLSDAGSKIKGLDRVFSRHFPSGIQSITKSGPTSPAFPFPDEFDKGRRLCYDLLIGLSCTFPVAISIITAPLFAWPCRSLPRCGSPEIRISSELSLVCTQAGTTPTTHLGPNRTTIAGSVQAPPDEFEEGVGLLPFP